MTMLNNGNAAVRFVSDTVGDFLSKIDFCSALTKRQFAD